MEKIRATVLPTVSVVTPARDIASWIGAAVRSVLDQTFVDFEYIIIDDGSVDSTAEIASSFADDRLTVLRTEGRGLSAARNAAIAASTGRYVAFLDGDDLWMPKKLERHVAVLEAHPEIDLTFSWSRIIDESGAGIGYRQRATPGAAGFTEVMTSDVIGNGSAVVVRRSALEMAGPFDETLRAATDFDEWLRIAALRPRNCWCVPELLTLYRRRTRQVTSNWRLGQTETEKVMQKVRNSLAPSAAMLTRADATNHRFYAFIAYESGESRVASKLLAQAFRLAPWFLLRDGRAWSLAGAIAGRMMLPARTFMRVRDFARRVGST
jgi:glycosyltransferase involved in cell wall biosynthesis